MSSGISPVLISVIEVKGVEDLLTGQILCTHDL